MAKKNYNIKELREAFENSDKSKLALPLLEKAEFLEETLNELKLKIQSDGVVTEMCQGSYVIERENPALKSYNSTVKNYTTIIKQLNELLPKNENPDDDGFESFGDD